MKKWFSLAYFLSVLWTPIVARGNHTAGIFRMPFNENQYWGGGCVPRGYTKGDETGYEGKGQYFMQLNKDLIVPKYHTAEDWNSKCGNDFGAPLYALETGVVQYINNRTLSDPTGKVLIIRYTLPDGSQVDSVHYHLNSIAVTQGATVVKGQQVGTIGDSNGAWPSHLHWEMRKDLSLHVEKDPYYPILSPTDALRYTAPALFVDNRKSTQSVSLSKGTWNYFYPSTNIPGSTAFIQYSTLRLSLKKAFDLGLIYGQVQIQLADGLWYVYHPDISKTFFEKGYRYRIWAYQNATLRLLIPGNTQLADRARIDMVRIAARNTLFNSVLTETYKENLDWDVNYQLRSMDIVEGAIKVTMYHITYKGNPLIRYVAYQDAYSGVWSPWLALDWNRID